MDGMPIDLLQQHKKKIYINFLSSVETHLQFRNMKHLNPFAPNYMQDNVCCAV